MEGVTPKTWVEVSAEALVGNARALRKLLGPHVQQMAVVKANAYGHGLTLAANALQECVDWFGVDSITEAIALRDSGISKPILIMGYTVPENIHRVVEGRFSQVCYTRDAVSLLSEAASAKNPAKVHLKIETGIARQGIHRFDLPAFLHYLKTLPNVVVEGVATHYANVDEAEDPTYAEQQLQHFNDALTVLRSMNVEPTVTHTACSAAAILYPQTHFSMVRIGIAMYGMWPIDESRVKEIERSTGVELTPALSWKTRIAQVKDLEAGSPVSYGLTERVERDSQVAVLPIGYWDGYDRGLSRIGEVLIHGKRAKVLGRVCMNIIMVDVTDIPDAREHDEVILLGSQGDESIRAEEHAKQLATITREIVTRINPVIPRIKVK